MSAQPCRIRNTDGKLSLTGARSYRCAFIPFPYRCRNKSDTLHIPCTYLLVRQCKSNFRRLTYLLLARFLLGCIPLDARSGRYALIRFLCSEYASTNCVIATTITEPCSAHIVHVYTIQTGDSKLMTMTLTHRASGIGTFATKASHDFSFCIVFLTLLI